MKYFPLNIENNCYERKEIAMNERKNNVISYVKYILYTVSDVVLMYFKWYCILTGLILLSEINALSGVINETLLMESIESLKTGTYLSDCIIIISSLTWLVLIYIFLMHEEVKKYMCL